MDFHYPMGETEILAKKKKKWTKEKKTTLFPEVHAPTA